MQFFSRYTLHCKLSASSAFDGGLLYVAGGYFIKFIRLVVFMLVWKSLLDNGGDNSGMTLSQVLTYTFFSSILSEQLNIVTPATTDFGDGTIISRYLRPMPILLQFMTETIGRWIPSFLLFTIPITLAAPFLGIDIFPVSTANGFWFIPSFIMSVSLGFALDFVFASLVVYMKNASWTAYVIRQAIMRIFSGAMIPFAMLPWGIGNILSLLPFGSVAGAPLAIYTGSDNAMQLFLLQLFWNVVVWSFAIPNFRKSEERMVSYGG